MGIGATLPLLFMYLHIGLGVGAGVVALIVIFRPLMALVGNPVGGILAGRIGARRATLLVLVAASVATAGMAGIDGAGSAAVAVAGYGLATALQWSALDALLVIVVPERQRGAVFAMRSVTLNLGGVVGAGLAALVLGQWPVAGFSWLYLLDAGSFLVLAVLIGVRRIVPVEQPKLVRKAPAAPVPLCEIVVLAGAGWLIRRLERHLPATINLPTPASQVPGQEPVPQVVC
ncbi:MFS transporter [Streptomyces sp. NPDC048404]|uniref:MFS transporter n=1 Tax=unclassified Streptomyces TaxID=2593676 RepID=UPI00343AA020